MGETLGIMYLEDSASSQFNSLQSAGFEQTTINRRANAVAERISFALANLKLRELLRDQSIRDPLTERFKRRYFQESLNRELHHASPHIEIRRKI
jgi:GGDEF domain-containing protein